ncbi:MAG TPA: ABC transporter permease [Burkholderiales bacterium]|nr:ABC transporter permease [Burkholderiales bacterium]
MTERPVAYRDHLDWARTLSISRYTLLEAWRNRFVVVVLVLVAALLVASFFVEQLAITESRRVQVGFLAAALRASIVFVTVLYVLQGMVREFQDKVVEIILSLDLPRASYVLGKFFAYLVLCAACAALCAAPLFLLADAPQVAAWAVTLMLELWLLAAGAVFCMVTFNQLLPAATFVFSFYLLGRSITAIQLMSTSTLAGTGPGAQAAARLADLLAFVLPRLDAFAQTAWLVDSGAPPLSLPMAALQTGIYVGLLLAAAMFDLYRRNF